MSNFKEGQVHQFAERFEAEGGTPQDLTRLGQFPDFQSLLGVLRGTHEIKVKEILSFCVTIDRSLSPEQALKATGRKLYINDSVVATMPRSDKNEEEVFFVKRDRWTSDEEWDAHLDSLGLKPRDPFTLAKHNEDDPAFADDHPNCTHWKDADGKWCFVAFSRWNGERYVDVLRNDGAWHGDWWFAGVRK